MKPLVFGLLLLGAGIACAADDQPTRHEHDRGGCDGFSWDMARELNLLRAAPFALDALAATDPEPKYTPLDRRLDLTLKPAGEVKLLLAPGRDPGAESYAGLLPLVVPRMSTYRISSDQRLWIDVVGPAGAVKSTKFTMQPGCDKLHKSVAFHLEPETQYWIQLSGSPASNPVLLITLDR
jgi:hypothetical protein